MRLWGNRPAELEVYSRADASVRFRISTAGQQDVASVDLIPQQVDLLIAQLQGFRAGQSGVPS